MTDTIVQYKLNMFEISYLKGLLYDQLDVIETRENHTVNEVQEIYTILNKLNTSLEPIADCVRRFTFGANPDTFGPITYDEALLSYSIDISLNSKEQLKVKECVLHSSIELGLKTIDFLEYAEIVQALIVEQLFNKICSTVQ